MFSLNGSCDELVFEILSNPCQQSQHISNMDYATLDPLPPPPPLPLLNSTISNNDNNCVKKSLPTKIPGVDSEAAAADDFNLRKIMHRDIERHRRREMSALYSSLRSLLPLHYLKGKRSVSDHMHEAVNYIKEMQAKMKELEKRRDMLRINSTTSCENVSENGSGPNTTVTVSPCRQGGLEILISVSCIGSQCFPISRLLKELLKEDLDVLTCVSTKVNQMSLYTIQTEACNVDNINFQALQQKLIDTIKILELVASDV